MTTLKEKLRQYREAAPFQAPAYSDLVQRTLDTQFTKNPDGSYSKHSDDAIDLTDDWIKHGKLWMRFKHWIGDFNCESLGLTSLEGCPETVDGNFNCTYNRLANLKGGPVTTTKSYDCSSCGLTALDGGPKEVGDDFDCSSNTLTTLKGVPQNVGGYFNCRFNPGNFTETDVRALTNVGRAVRTN